LLAPRRKAFFLSLGVLICYLSLVGCFYNLDVDKSSFRKVNFQDFQPVAILPIQDASGYPQSGSDLNSFIYNFLAAKGYNLIAPGEVSSVFEEFGLTPQILLSSQSSLIKTNERLKAKLLITGTLLEYSLQKPYVRSESFQVWDGGRYEYRALPTYYQGTCQIKLMLRVLELERGSVLWMAEGRIRGPSLSAKNLGKRLVERLLNELPSLPPQSAK
jgi:hypothetical protein